MKKMIRTSTALAALSILTSLSLTSTVGAQPIFQNNHYTITEQQLSNTLEATSDNPISESLVDAVLNAFDLELRERIFKDDVLINNHYYYLDTIGLGCETNDCNREELSKQLANETIITGVAYREQDQNAGDDLFLRSALNDLINKSSSYISTQAKSYKDATSAEWLKSASLTAWAQAEKDLPLTLAFSSQELCIKFMNEYINILDELMYQQKVHPETQEHFRKAHRIGFGKLEKRKKRLQHHRLQMKEAQSAGLDQSYEIANAIADRLSISTEQVDEVLTHYHNITRLNLNKGYAFTTENGGLLAMTQAVTGPNTEQQLTLGHNDEPLKLDAERGVEDVFILPQTSYSIPPKSTSGRGVCLRGKCFLSAATAEHVNQNLSLIEEAVKETRFLISSPEDNTKRIAGKIKDLRGLAQDIRVEIQTMKNDK